MFLTLLSTIRFALGNATPSPDMNTAGKAMDVVGDIVTNDNTKEIISNAPYANVTIWGALAISGFIIILLIVVFSLIIAYILKDKKIQTSLIDKYSNHFDRISVSFDKLNKSVTKFLESQEYQFDKLSDLGSKIDSNHDSLSRTVNNAFDTIRNDLTYIERQIGEVKNEMDNDN